MSNISNILPIAIGAILSWFVIRGLVEFYSEASAALTKKIHA